MKEIIFFRYLTFFAFLVCVYACTTDVERTEQKTFKEIQLAMQADTLHQSFLRTSHALKTHLLNREINMESVRRYAYDKDGYDPCHAFENQSSLPLELRKNANVVKYFLLSCRFQNLLHRIYERYDDIRYLSEEEKIELLFAGSNVNLTPASLEH